MHEISPKVLRKSFKNVAFFGNVVIYALLSQFWKYHDLRTLGNIFGSIFLTGNILALFSALVVCHSSLTTKPSQAVIRVGGLQVEAISPLNCNQFKVEYQLPSIADKIIFSEIEKKVSNLTLLMIINLAGVHYCTLCIAM